MVEGCWRCWKQARQWHRDVRSGPRCSPRWTDELLAAGILARPSHRRRPAFSPIAPPGSPAWSSPWHSVDDLRRSDGVLGKASTVMPAEGRMSRGLAFQGDLASLFLATRMDARLRRHGGPASRRLSAFVAATTTTPSFRRSGRVPRPLSLSGLYPQFSPVWEVSPGSFGSGRPGGGSRRAPRQTPGLVRSVSPNSGRIYRPRRVAALTLRLGQDEARGLAIPAADGGEPRRAVA